jgi:hypothetical protein
MSVEKNGVKELLQMKNNLQTALETNNRDDIKKYFEEFKALYEKITLKKFEEDIPAEKLNQILSVINGTVKEGKETGETEEFLM